MWTLEKELCNLSHTKDIKDALTKLSIINSNTGHFEVIEDGKWERGGAETYIFKFSVKHDGTMPIFYILKACVSFSPGIKPEKMMDGWIYRRELIKRYGISTPKLYWHGDGILLEEYIQYSLHEVFRSNIVKTKDLLLNLARWAGVLNHLNFLPISPFSDLRSRGSDLVVVDFGEDLGGHGNQVPEGYNLFEKLILKIKEWGIEPSTEILRAMKFAYLNDSRDFKH